MNKFFIKVLLIAGIIALAYGFLSGPPVDSTLSVLTEAGQAKEARYREWKTQEDESRARQREQDRFLQRYEEEKKRPWRE